MSHPWVLCIVNKRWHRTTPIKVLSGYQTWQAALREVWGEELSWRKALPGVERYSEEKGNLDQISGLSFCAYLTVWSRLVTGGLRGSGRPWAWRRNTAWRGSNHPCPIWKVFCSLNSFPFTGCVVDECLPLCHATFLFSDEVSPIPSLEKGPLSAPGSSKAAIFNLWPQEFLKHATPDYLVRGLTFFPWDCQIKKW